MPRNPLHAHPLLSYFHDHQRISADDTCTSQFDRPPNDTHSNNNFASRSPSLQPVLSFCYKIEP